jgi:putative transposase
MALSQSALLEILDAIKEADVADRVRESAATIYQALIEAELTAVIGAEPHERTDARTGQRNGHRSRTLSTSAGDLELRIPKLRAGSFFPCLLERRRRVDQALYAVVMETYLHGVSTRKVDDLVKALGVDAGISKSEVSRICVDLDEEVAAFRGRTLKGEAYPYVFLDATYCKARVNRRVVSQAVVVATAVRADGNREVLGFDVGDSEDGAFWTAFLRSLKARGLHGVQRVISDAHEGLKVAIGSVFARRQLATLPGALPAQRPHQGPERQRRDGRRRDPHDLRPTRRRARPLPARHDRHHARPTVPRRGGDAHRRQTGPARVHVLPGHALEEDLVHQPPGAGQQRDQTPHRRRRRLPQPPALLRLAGAVLVEIHDEWAVTDRRYLSEGSMKAITTTTKEVAPTTALTA